MNFLGMRPSPLRPLRGPGWRAVPGITGGAGPPHAPPPAGSGNPHTAQLKGAAAHLPSAQACRCDALAPSPIGSIATPHTHVHTRGAYGHRHRCSLVRTRIGGSKRRRTRAPPVHNTTPAPEGICGRRGAYGYAPHAHGRGMLHHTGDGPVSGWVVPAGGRARAG